MSDIRFDGRVAIVAGAGSGIGRRSAQLLAERGARVVINDAQADDAVAVAKEIEDAGGVAMPSSGVVDTPEGAQAVIDATINGFGGVDILVIDTGRSSDIGSSDALLGETDPVTLLAGLFGGYWLTQAAWTHLRERRYGRIVLSCALGNSVADDMQAGNTVANMGLFGVMNILKCEGPDRDIMVNMVAPTTTGDPDVLIDLVGYLGHESCVTAGEIFTVHADGMSRMFMGVNEGIVDPGLTTESVRDHLGEILDPRTFMVPDEAGQEIQQLLLPHLR